MINRSRDKNKKPVEFMSDGEIQSLHDAFMNKVEQKANSFIKKSGLQSTDNLLDFAKELLLYMHKLRVKTEFQDDEFVDTLKSYVENGEQFARASFQQIRKRVQKRESENSGSYGAAELSKADVSWIMQADTLRKDEPVVEEFFEGKKRVYIRMPEQESETRVKVEKLLAAQPEQYIITDWKSGKATDSKGKQAFKIGKILSKLDEGLYEDFQHDPSRTAGKMVVVISRDPDDIARASTNRAWYSCAGAGSLSGAGRMWAFGRMAGHIEAGGMIAYLTSENDPDINYPMARVMIKPFKKATERDPTMVLRNGFHKLKSVFSESARKRDKLFIIDKIYGLSNSVFEQLVCSVIDQKINATALLGRFIIDRRVYEDVKGIAKNKGHKIETSLF